MQKLHRRKNEQISKQFVCSEGCGKAYASYAAVYTHVKNKHPSAKPPQMKSPLVSKVPLDSIRGSFKSFPMTKEQEGPSVVSHDCLRCRRIDCLCLQEINLDQMQKSIAILQDQTFIKLIALISQLESTETLRITRDTQTALSFMSKQALRHLVFQFNKNFQDLNISSLVLSQKIIQYLSFCSQYLNERHNIQFINSIFLLVSKKDQKQADQIIMKRVEFENIKKVLVKKQKEWSEFANFIRAL